MTLDQIVTFCRQRHNAESKTFWSDPEILSLVTAVCDEITTIIGLVEVTDTSLTTVANQQAYDFPSEMENIVELLVDGKPLRRITFQDWRWKRQEGASTETITGSPEEYIVWNEQILLVPIPTTASLQMTIYAESRQAFLTATTDTFNMPAAVHTILCERVIGRMFEKDLNPTMAQLKANEWERTHIPRLHRYKSRHRRRGKPSVVQDTDSIALTGGFFG